MNNFIDVVTPEGEEKKAEVLDIFTVEGYEDKDYILYTFGKEVDENNIEVFVSVLRKDGDVFNLENIEDETEWEEVQQAIDEAGEVNGR